MRASYRDRQKYGNLPGATRGVVREYRKLIRPNPQYQSLLDEMDVEVRAFGNKDFRIRANSEPVGESSYKDLAHAREVLFDYVQNKRAQGWKVMNERREYTIDSEA